MISIRKCFLAGLCIVLSLCVANSQVQRGAYRAMLNKLLSHTVPEVQVQQVVADTTPVVFLDAREPAEYDVSHLANALPVGYDSFQIDKIPVAISKSQKIVVYCSVGYRSEKVCEKLRAAGYTDVANLYGGIFEWVNQGHEVVDQHGPTTRVHAYNRSWGVWLRKGKKVY
jgi:rhodanese-related sulfurtransferase